ncbi:ABC transporter permease [Clostridium thermarum]|uniref:ABC transporter permease n=1 Tax=Clostridium thermarum TaxID=1716543 RepID=UPI001120B67D|nr:ABC transporter permease [Clostridium thermarum]
MREIFLIAANTLKIIFRKKSNIILFIIIPVTITLAMMFLFSNASSGTIRIGIYNQDQGKLGSELASNIAAVEKFKAIEVNEEGINDLVQSQKVDCVIIIPTDFSEKLYKGKSAKVSMKTIKGEDTTIWIENFTNMFIENLMIIGKASEGRREVFRNILDGYMDGNIKLSIGKVEDVSISRQTTSRSLGMLIMFMMYAATITSSLIIKEKQGKTFYRVQTAPVSSKAVVFGNTLANLIIVAIQAAIVAITINHVLNMNSGIGTLYLVIVLLFFGLVSISMGMVIIAFSQSTAQSASLATLVTTPTCMLGGCFWPVSFMPQVLQRVSDFMPQRWALKAIESLQTGSSLNEILVNLGILIAFAIMFSTIAAYKFKNNKSVGSFI